MRKVIRYVWDVVVGDDLELTTYIFISLYEAIVKQFYSMIKHCLKSQIIAIENNIHECRYSGTKYNKYLITAVTIRRF